MDVHGRRSGCQGEISPGKRETGGEKKAAGGDLAVQARRDTQRAPVIEGPCRVLSHVLYLPPDAPPGVPPDARHVRKGRCWGRRGDGSAAMRRFVYVPDGGFGNGLAARAKQQELAPLRGRLRKDWTGVAFGALGRWGRVPLKGDQQQPTRQHCRSVHSSPQHGQLPLALSSSGPVAGWQWAGQWALLRRGALGLQEGAALGLSAAPARWSHWGLACHGCLPVEVVARAQR
ncbi:hypothetical protein TgHK011_004227 [Trichoderma gracile]|nr:hypothetical protein TgHK011_004227 [Trichoderma gracile]